MNDSHFIYLTHTDDIESFPENEVSDFQVNIKPPVKIGFDEIWSLAVTEINFTPNSLEPILLCCNICQDSYVGNKQFPVLRKFYPSSLGNTHFYRYAFPYYVKTRPDTVQRLRLYLIDDKGKPLSFTDTALNCTLHLRKHSLFTQT